MQRQSLYQDVWKSRQHQRDVKASPVASTVSSMRRGKSAPLLTESRARKPPVIHPGDEVPLLVWGGEGSALRAAMRRLTEAGKPAMLGIDVLAQDKA